eukprot:scaffold1734_cov113-Isochrysis_galbana.AAC.32
MRCTTGKEWEGGGGGGGVRSDRTAMDKRCSAESPLLKIKAINTPLPPLFFPPTQMRGGKLREGGSTSTSNPNKKTRSKKL